MLVFFSSSGYRLQAQTFKSNISSWVIKVVEHGDFSLYVISRNAATYDGWVYIVLKKKLQNSHFLAMIGQLKWDSSDIDVSH